MTRLLTTAIIALALVSGSVSAQTPAEEHHAAHKAHHAHHHPHRQHKHHTVHQ